MFFVLIGEVAGMDVVILSFVGRYKIDLQQLKDWGIWGRSRNTQISLVQLHAPCA